MILSEQHIFTRGSKAFSELERLCRNANNLYNATMYCVRQEFFVGTILTYEAVNEKFIQDQQSDYYSLPTKISQQIQRIVGSAWKSYFAAVKDYKKNPSKYQGKPCIPGYKEKGGFFVVPFTRQSIAFNNRNVPDVFLRLSGTSILIKTKQKEIQAARLVPQDRNHIKVEILYKVACPEIMINGRIASIDLGVNNLATIIYPNSRTEIINGRPLKSINQYYNKKLAEVRSRNSKRKQQTRREVSLRNKRRNKINDYLHKASRYIVNQLVSNDVTELVIGYNAGWKQDTRMKKVGNQRFQFIPFYKFISMLVYKCALVGIKVTTNEESYTSKCSFLDNEEVCKHTEYKGKRVKRGLFRASDGRLINADVNGALNILIKYMEKAVRNKEGILNSLDLIEVCSTPSVYTVKLAA
ncbi:MAG: transposase [Synergistaceae bacterium]|nr:transposase [Synergistaceae bacterium]